MPYHKHPWHVRNVTGSWPQEYNNTPNRISAAETNLYGDKSGTQEILRVQCVCAQKQEHSLLFYSSMECNTRLGRNQNHLNLVEVSMSELGTVIPSCLSVENENVKFEKHCLTFLINVDFGVRVNVLECGPLTAHFTLAYTERCLQNRTAGHQAQNQKLHMPCKNSINRQCTCQICCRGWWVWGLRSRSPGRGQRVRPGVRWCRCAGPACRRCHLEQLGAC